jgi:hypothetical protein
MSTVPAFFHETRAKKERRKKAGVREKIGIARDRIEARNFMERLRVRDDLNF